MLRVLVFVAFLGLSVSAAQAADIRVETVADGGDELTFILIDGELIEGDATRFAEVALNIDTAFVIFSSPGGNLLTGMEIGTYIRLKRFVAAVASDTTCMSACALAWLAGFPRFMGSNESVGFHAAWEGDGVPSPGGNALVGAYLNRLGFTDDFIVFATSARPDGMDWLSFEEAARMGVPVLPLEDESPTGLKADSDGGAMKREPEVAAPGLPGPELTHWIQLYSRRTFAEATMLAAETTTKLADPVSVFEYRNGWFVVALGPYAETDVGLRLSELSEAGAIPADSTVTDGGNHSALLWHDDGEGRASRGGIEARAIDFVVSLQRLWSLPNSAALAALRPMLAPSIEYFGVPMSREAVMEEKKRFAERWPQRDYFLDPKGVTTECDAAGNCTVEGVVAWRTHSPARDATASGLARVRYEVSGSSPPLIISEHSEVTSRDVAGESGSSAEDDKVIETYFVANTEPDDSLNMRTGPGTDYPILVELRRGTRGVAVGWCEKVDGYSIDWCHVAWQGKLGWASACCLIGEKTGRRPGTLP
jgi:hypothetical protein